MDTFRDEKPCQMFASLLKRVYCIRKEFGTHGSKLFPLCGSPLFKKGLDSHAYREEVTKVVKRTEDLPAVFSSTKPF